MIAGATGSSLQRTAPAFNSSKPTYVYSVVAIDSADQKSVATSANISIEQNSTTGMWAVNVVGGVSLNDIVDGLNASVGTIAALQNGAHNASFAAVGNQIQVTCKNGWTINPKYPGQKKQIVGATSWGAYIAHPWHWMAALFDEVGTDENGTHRPEWNPWSVGGWKVWQGYVWSYGCYPPL